MSARGQSRAKLLLKAAAAAALLGTFKLLFSATGKPSGQPPREDRRKQKPIEGGASSKRSDQITYGVGYVLALVLTCAAFALVHCHWASGATALGVIFALALIQAVVHFRCFLHVSLGRSARDDLELVLFSSLIIAVMAGGTLVVLFNLRARMM